MHVNTNKIGSALVQTYKIYEQKRSIGEKERAPQFCYQLLDPGCPTIKLQHSTVSQAHIRD